MKCKYRFICPYYDKDSELCKDNGTWSFDKKANCYLAYYDKEDDKFNILRGIVGAILGVIYLFYQAYIQ